jgi:hypothetical protein
MQTAQHVRMFEVKFLGPTNTRGARVVVKDTRRRPEVRVYLSYDYAVGDILKQAQAWLVNERGIQCLYHASTKDAYYLLSENFETEIRDEK